MIDYEASRRLNLLRFPPIVGILYIHAFNTTIPFADATLGRPETNALTDFIRVLISQGLARIAVPIFFLLAGYLFFVNFRWSIPAYFRKLRSRFRSLCVPFLFWNSLMLSMVALSQTMPEIGPYFPEGPSLVTKYTLFQYIDAMLGLTRYPIAYHMWFIRDLMFLVLLVPVIVIVLRFAALPFLFVVFLCWVRGVWPVLAPGAVGVLFFCGGAFCAIKGKSLFAWDRFGPLALLLSLPILLADTLCYSTWINIYLHRTGLIVEVIAILYATRVVARHAGLSNWIVKLGDTSFFVYAAHEPLLGILRTLAYRYVPLDWPYTILLLYLTIPALVVVVMVWLYRSLAASCPRALNLITGGRVAGLVR